MFDYVCPLRGNFPNNHHSNLIIIMAASTLRIVSLLSTQALHDSLKMDSDVDNEAFVEVSGES